MKKALLYTDGASSGNPGESGIGVVLIMGDKTYKISEYIGTATNNVAEYSALIRGLKMARELNVSSIEVFLDSELLVRQLRGIYRVRDKKLVALWEEAKNLFLCFRNFSISHIRRELNKKADALAKKGSQLKKKIQVKL